MYLDRIEVYFVQGYNTSCINIKLVCLIYQYTCTSILITQTKLISKPCLCISVDLAEFLRIIAILTYKTTITVKGKAMSANKFKAKQRVLAKSDTY